jgi:hypothetical protein
MTNLTPHIASAPTGDVPLGRKDTIATVVIDGQRYEIDWPRDDEDPDQRNPFLAAIYFPDGELVHYIESGEPDGFLRETDVITAAMEWFTHACLLASGLLIPAEADQPIRAVQVRPHHRQDFAALLGRPEAKGFQISPTIAMLTGPDGDKRLNMLASMLRPRGPITGDVLLLGIEGTPLTSLSEQAMAELAEIGIEPGRCARDVASALLADVDTGAV